MVAISGTACAKSSKYVPDISSDSFSVSASTGALSGDSQEKVYDTDTGRKLSQLDWKIRNVAIVKGELSWDAYSFMTLNARMWTSVATGSGRMDDYDWLDRNQSDWTHHSSHPDTSMNYANEYDLNLKGWLFVHDNYKAGVVAGFQETRFSWTANGGTYSYNNGIDVGSFPAGERSIGYSQRFSMPYIGLTGQYRINNFEFNALFKYSDWVTARDNDEHYLRGLNFREKTKKSRYYGIAIDGGYYITRNARVFAEFAYSKYKEGKGGTEIIDYSDGSAEFAEGNAAGISNKNKTITAGLQYVF